MAKILFVAKDNGCASVTEQVAVLAREDGHDVVVALEGLAIARYENLGLPVYIPPNYIGAIDFRAPTCPAEKYAVLNFSAKKFLDEIRPDIIVTGVGSPINIQCALAEKATLHGIPLVICEDFWSKIPGHFNSTTVEPSLVLTVDEYSMALNKHAFPDAEMRVVGNPGVKKVSVPASVINQMDALKREFDYVCVYAGGGPESILPELKLLMECIEKTSGTWCVIPGFHPKYNDLKLEGMKKSFGEIWREYLAPFADRVRYVKHATEEGKLAPTDQTAVCADMVASGFSTIMSTAVSCGVPAVCLNTPETMAALRAHGQHYTEIPQVGLGIAPEVKEPQDISSALKAPSPETIAKIVPYDPKKAYDHIRELL